MQLVRLVVEQTQQLGQGLLGTNCTPAADTVNGSPPVACAWRRIPGSSW
jgi:hypothetical protein